MSEAKGKAKEAVGWVTGDREVEAEGRAEERADDPVDLADTRSDETVAEEKERVREEHGDK